MGAKKDRQAEGLGERDRGAVKIAGTETHRPSMETEAEPGCQREWPAAQEGVGTVGPGVSLPVPCRPMGSLLALA